ncbi:MAG: preprotein translocase subunit SecA [Proteobacteria bacterium]|nr:preprotein translocase subunit SecA [Pseudomonadota bacterium]
MLTQLKSIFGSKNERTLAPYRSRVGAINALADNISTLTDSELQARFNELRQQRQNGATALDLLNNTFAVVREAAARTLQMRHFDQQLLGGMALFDGNIAEMKTGEGKTLVATLPVCLEALSGSVHVVTVNDYLAQRDAEWMGVLYRFLGLQVGVNCNASSTEEKAAAYACDITYGTNNEFGFDYLRHNMRYSADTPLQSKLNFAIVDEVDSILIDEARTPLVISGESNDEVTLYNVVAALSGKFTRSQSPEDNGDFTLDEKARTVHLTEQGFDHAEKIFVAAKLIEPGDSLYATDNLPLLHHLDIALRARHLFLRDRDYVVQDGQVIIVDEFTGRLMPGRRWGDNQHQAVEAKEKVAVQKENRTLASISFQNYFRLYKKLAGMTGTAMTEAQEFEFIYGLRSIEIPTHQKMIRNDELDKVYRSAAARDRAVIVDIQEAHAKKQPILVGTTAIEASERLSGKLAEIGLAHHVLNAKQHDKEASIIAQAGAPDAITIATNMAGRGTDIVLGGNLAVQQQAINNSELTESEKQQQSADAEAAWKIAHAEVVAAGGLRIIGTERHESRRIDNQLRGRAGRQGDPGSSIFYLSFEDALLRIFATRHVSALMEKLNIEEDEAIEAKMVSRTIENAQRKVESHNFDIRRQLLEYDDIANEQRSLIYEQREEILTSEQVNKIAEDFRLQHLEELCNEYLPPNTAEEEWRTSELDKLLAGEYRLKTDMTGWISTEANKPREYFVDKLKEYAEQEFSTKFTDADHEQVNQFMRMLILNIIDDHWRRHLSALDGLRQSIGFRGVAQKNPQQEYKREAFEMFNRLLSAVQASISKMLYALTVKKQGALEGDASGENAENSAIPAPPPPSEQNLRYQHSNASALTSAEPAAPANPANPASATTPATAIAAATTAPTAEPFTVQRTQPKIGRNSPCPCGSGKKYKHCCGKL